MKKNLKQSLFFILTITLCFIGNVSVKALENENTNVTSNNITTYQIKYDGNGNVSGEINISTTCQNNVDCILETNAYQKNGYVFAGWNTSADGTGTTYKAGASVQNLGTGSVTLYAKWKKANYTINYELNGGVNGNNPTSYTITTATIKLANPTKAGYTFAGWYTDSSYTTKVTQIKKGTTGNITLYAKWTANNYSIVYNGNDNTSGKMEMTTPCVYNTICKVEKSVFKRKGYTFVGWYTDSGYTNKVTRIQKGNTGNLTLYAKWDVNKYSISFNGNGSTNGTMSNINTKYDKSTVLPNNIYVKDGYVFKGWNTSANGSGTTYKNGARVKNLVSKNGKTVTLYAQWKLNVTYVTIGMQNALKSAKNYLSHLAFSRSGLIEQLEYEGFTHEEAVYGVNATGL